MITLYRFFFSKKKKALYIGFLNKKMLLVAVKMIYFLCQLFIDIKILVIIIYF